MPMLFHVNHWVVVSNMFHRVFPYKPSILVVFPAFGNTHIIERIGDIKQLYLGGGFNYVLIFTPIWGRFPI